MKMLNDIAKKVSAAHQPKKPSTGMDAEDAPPTPEAATPHEAMHSEISQHLSPAQHTVIKGIMAKHLGIK